MRRIELNSKGVPFSVHYTQRDLEDQIEEEYRKQGLNYQRTNTQTMSETRKLEAPKLSAKEVISLLKKGYTRLKEDDMGYGSIEEHYNLTPTQVKEAFKHPSLKARKTKLPLVEVIDDLNEDEGDEQDGIESDPTPENEQRERHTGFVASTTLVDIPFPEVHDHPVRTMIEHPVAIPTEQQEVVVTTASSAVTENDLFN